MVYLALGAGCAEAGEAWAGSSVNSDLETLILVCEEP